MIPTVLALMSAGDADFSPPTAAVQIRDWYTSGEKKTSGKRHQASPAAKACHEQRKQTRREYLQLFGEGKKKRQQNAA